MFLTQKQFMALLPEVRPPTSFSGPLWPSVNDRGLYDEGESALFLAQFRAFIGTLPFEQSRIVGPCMYGSKAAKRTGISLAILQAELPADGLNSFGMQSWLTSSLDAFKLSCAL
jgi:hypothetical protein